MKLTFTLPMRLDSVANRRGNWRAHFFSKTKPQRQTAKMATVAFAREQGFELKLPVKVEITRIAPRELDAADNLATACKSVIDGIADAFGVRDSSPEIQFLPVKQQRGGVREYAVSITIERLLD